MTTREIKVKIEGKEGADVGALVVQTANAFSSSIYVESANKRLSAKSIMGMLHVGFVAGEVLTFSADGADEKAALDAIQELLEE